MHAVDRVSGGGVHERYTAFLQVLNLPFGSASGCLALAPAAAREGIGSCIKIRMVAHGSSQHARFSFGAKSCVPCFSRMTFC